MRTYQVTMNVVAHSRHVGLAYVLVTATSRLDAAIMADAEIEDTYGKDAYGHVVRVEPVDEMEMAVPMAA